MKLAAPIAAVDDVATLAAAGADEFYCGVVPHEWESRFGRSTLNRRLGGNLHSFAELADAAQAAHACGRKLSVAFNAQKYTRDRWGHLMELVERIAASGADAIIVGDFGLLTELSARSLPLRIHLSSVASCHNSATAGLAAELGAARVILPRHVTLAEMERMVIELPALEFEAFVLNDGCVFEEGSCHTLHLPMAMGGPICLDRFEYEYRREDCRALSDPELKRLAANDKAHEKWLWYMSSCGFTTTPDGTPYGPCGLCAIPRMARAGIAAVKIAGRDGPLARRTRAVEMVRRVLDLSASRRAEGGIAELARQMRGKPELCTSGYMCYYRETAPAAVPDQIVDVD